ncbi:MAG: class I SAM-dependent methyltransferase [Thermoanaerobaculia bacterium]
MYREDLAYIHHAGFSEFAESASRGILQILRNAGVTAGRVVDAGCGSGVLARELTRAGFDVFGFDISPSMIALARETAPEAEFAVASLASPLPPCAAIVAVGEIVNYAGLDAVRTFIHNAAGALQPGGVLLFDAAESDSYPPYDERRVDGGDWTVIAIKESDGAKLTRRVLTFRADGDTMRRDEEVHELELYDRAELTQLMRDAGFRVKVRRSYGSRRLPMGHEVYVGLR